MTMKREDRSVKAAQAERLLDDPAFKTAVERVEGNIIRLMKNANLNGDEAVDGYTTELVRKLQTIAAVQTSLQAEIDSVKLMNHNKSIKAV